MKRKLTLMIIAICLFETCFAEYRLTDFRNSAGGMDAYAWNEDYLFIAHGYSCDGDYLRRWESGNYSIMSVNRENGETSVLFERVYGRYVNLFMDGDVLFAIWENTNEICDSITLISIDVYSNVIKCMSTMCLLPNEYLNDAVVYEKCAFIITNKRIFKWNAYNINTIYTFTGKSNNSFYYNHIIVDDGTLYFQEDSFIMSIDLNSEDVCLVCEINVMNEENGYDNYAQRFRLGSWQYNYAVINGVVYYYDVTSQHTVSFDILQKKMTILSFDEIYFFYLSDEMVIYRRVVKQNDELYCTTHIVSIAGRDAVDFPYDKEVPWTKLEDFIIPIGFGEYIKPYTLKLYEDSEKCCDKIMRIYTFE